MNKYVPVEIGSRPSLSPVRAWTEQW